MKDHIWHQVQKEISAVEIQNMCNLAFNQTVVFPLKNAGCHFLYKISKLNLFPLHSQQALFGETENVNEQRVNEGRVGEIGFKLTLTRREDK